MKSHLSVLLLALIITFATSATAQFGNADIEILEQYYKSFDYNKVIQKSDQILAHRDQLSKEQNIQVLETRALAHYSLMQMDLSLKDFIEILNLAPNYSLDPKTTSPKIITFFNEIKQSFQINIPEPAIQVLETQTDTVIEFIDNSNLIKNSTIRSILLPGWGHIYSGQKKKGWLLTSASAVTLVYGIFLVNDCNNTRSAYLSETDPLLIQDRYEEYNSSYKNRNLLLSAYSVLWLYTQTDLLWFTDFDAKTGKSFSLLPQIGPNGNSMLTLNYHW